MGVELTDLPWVGLTVKRTENGHGGIDHDLATVRGRKRNQNDIHQTLILLAQEVEAVVDIQNHVHDTKRIIEEEIGQEVQVSIVIVHIQVSEVIHLKLNRKKKPSSLVYHRWISLEMSRKKK